MEAQTFHFDKCSQDVLDGPLAIGLRSPAAPITLNPQKKSDESGIITFVGAYVLTLGRKERAACDPMRN